MSYIQVNFCSLDFYPLRSFVIFEALCTNGHNEIYRCKCTLRIRCPLKTKRRRVFSNLIKAIFRVIIPFHIVIAELNEISLDPVLFLASAVCFNSCHACLLGEINLDILLVICDEGTPRIVVSA